MENLSAQGDTKCRCSAGYFRDNEFCRACPRNSFKSSTSDSLCTPCPEGASTEQSGSRRLSDCRCPQGLLAHYGLNTFVCRRCPHSAWPLNGRCACNAGYTGSNCTLCPQGACHVPWDTSKSACMCAHIYVDHLHAQTLKYTP